VKQPTPPGREPARTRPRSLCELCRHVRRIESAKGSGFLLCRRSESEPRFPKYPPQPVVECGGFES
jgi:hypothetical protein